MNKFDLNEVGGLLMCLKELLGHPKLAAIKRAVEEELERVNQELIVAESPPAKPEPRPMSVVKPAPKDPDFDPDVARRI